MEAFAWTDRYLTGEDQIDGEHRELVRMINDLIDLDATSLRQDVARQTLERLTSYAIHHFDHEETLMLEAGCDPRHVKQHQNSHARFKQHVADMLAAAPAKVDIELVFRFLTHWLSNHVLGFDKAMASQIILIRGGMSPADAYLEAHGNLSDDPASSLLEALAKMREELAARNTELAELNQSLEKEVEQRTQALVLANEHLLAEQDELQQRYAEISELNAKLTAAQEQLLQSEKLASIGQLAAGVAHEINNPIGFVHSNIGSLDDYLRDIFCLLAAYEETEVLLPAGEPRSALQRLRRQVEIDFLKNDIPLLVKETKDGISRVKQIVQDLKDFSHIDSAQEWETADLHRGIDSTLSIVANEIKYKAVVVKEYGDLPPIECLPSQLNQVFMNLLVNASHAMGSGPHGRITIRTGRENGEVWLEFVDNGSGISPETLPRIFEPFFTTKPIGKGTGLGLSLSYGIIQKHQGSITVNSEPGKGTCFCIRLPIKQDPAGVGKPSERAM